MLRAGGGTPAWPWLGGAPFTEVNLALLRGVPALFQVDPIGTSFRHAVDSLFELLVPR